MDWLALVVLVVSGLIVCDGLRRAADEEHGAKPE